MLFNQLKNRFAVVRTKTLIGILLGLLLLPSLVFAKSITLEQGQSRVIKTHRKVDTIFVSAPTVADYEILDDNSFVIYSKAEGISEVTSFDVNGEILTSDSVTVNSLLGGLEQANEQIKSRFPNTALSVKRVGKAYVIDGKAKSEVEQEEVRDIVGSALGNAAKTTEYTLQREGQPAETIDFLEKRKYEGVVDTSTTDEATQINVKLTVVEVNKKFAEQIGVEWSRIFTAGSGWVAGAVAGVGGSGNILSLNSDTLNLFVKAVNNQSSMKVLAEPNVSILSGETGDILVGGEIPFVQRNKDGESSVIYKEFGINLLVGAKVQKNNRIRLLLSQSVSTVAGNYDYNDIKVPYFSTRRSKSIFEVEDGGSFILGGLYSQQDVESLSKVPLVGDIPILGSFFRSASTDRESTELVIVATVNLVKPVVESDIVYPDFERTGTMERFFNTSVFKDVYHKTLSTNFLKRGGFIQ